MAWWYKHDVEVRKEKFPTLFEELIDLDAILADFMEEVILKEDIIKESTHCLELVINRFCEE